jgi:hypothetical protein
MFAEDDDPATTAMFQKLIANGLIRTSDLVENGFGVAATKVMIGDMATEHCEGSSSLISIPANLQSKPSRKRGAADDSEEEQEEADDAPAYPHQDQTVAAHDEDSPSAKRHRPSDSAEKDQRQLDEDGKDCQVSITVQNEDLLVEKLRQLALGDGESRDENGIEVEEGGVVFLPSWAGQH